ncbi:MAG: hypothetical protein QXI32_02800 [Candidatus Bathyarchaeia archaeon]
MPKEGKKEKTSWNIRVLFTSKYVLAIGSTISAVLVGFAHLRVLPITLDIQSVTEGIMLITLGIVILTTISREFTQLRKSGKSRFVLNDVIALALILPAMLLGFTRIAGIGYPQEVSGVIGMLHIILAIVMLFSVVTED